MADSPCVSPSRRQCAIAFRKLANYSERLIKQAQGSISKAKLPESSSTTTSNLQAIFPVELFIEIAQRLSPIALASLQATCKTLYAIGSEPVWWGTHTRALLVRAGLNDLHVKPEDINRKEAYVRVRQQFHSLSAASVFLMRLAAVSDSAVMDASTKEEASVFRKQVEEIFTLKLRIPSPWKTHCWEEKLSLDLADLPKTEGLSVLVSPDRTNMRLQLNVQDGFYSGEILQFSIRVSCYYPYEPPTIRTLTPVYHPLVEGDHVMLDIIRSDLWRSSQHSIVDVILGVHKLFTDSRHLTDNFTL